MLWWFLSFLLTLALSYFSSWVFSSWAYALLSEQRLTIIRQDSVTWGSVKAPDHFHRCTENITHGGNDGIGHQLAGAFSCMLLGRLSPHYCFVKRGGMIPHHVQHGCGKDCLGLYNALTAPWPTMTIGHAHQVDNCWHDVDRLCGEWFWTSYFAKGNRRIRLNETCARERQRLSREWQGLAEAFHIGRNVDFKPLDLAVHVRVGDRNPLLGNYTELFMTLSQARPTIFVESNHSAALKSVLEQFQVLPGIAPANLIVGGSPVHSWFQMLHARRLVMHDSSFSRSVYIVREGPTIGPGHSRKSQLHCKIPGTSWWWSPGFGRTDCPPWHG